MGPTDTGDNSGPRLCKKVSWLNSLRSVAMTFGPSPCRPGPGLVRSSPSGGRKVSRRVYLPSPDPRKIASDQPWPLWACFGHSQTTGANPPARSRFWKRSGLSGPVPRQPRRENYALSYEDLVPEKRSFFPKNPPKTQGRTLAPSSRKETPGPGQLAFRLEP